MPGQDRAGSCCFGADRQVWRHVTHCQLLFNGLLTVENENQGEKFPFCLPRNFQRHTITQTAQVGRELKVKPVELN